MADFNITGTLVTRGAEAALGWEDVLGYVQEVAPRDGARANASFYRTLGNQALRLISERTRMIYRFWDNSAAGDLALSGNGVLLPGDCMAVSSVEWSGDSLDRTSYAGLDRDSLGWRESVGDPSRFVVDGTSLVFDSAPQGVTTGKLVVRGFGFLPDFPEEDGAPNPLARLPKRFQIIPAYYIVANLPVVIAQPAGQTQEGFQYAQMLTKRRYEVKAEHMELWERELRLLADEIGGRSREAFVY